MTASDPKALEGALEALADAAGEGLPTLSLTETRRLAVEHGIVPRSVEIAALRQNIVPERYLRNHGTVGFAGQIALLEAKVVIVGAGGLGGWAAEGLARMGVGRLVVIDGDVFEENNLNRQLGCTESTIGKPKVSALTDRVRQVNGAVDVTACFAWLTEENAPELLQGADAVIDALDSFPARFLLEREARKLDIPMVHGAIAGNTGQVMTIFPGDPGLEALYGEGAHPEHGIETELGNPSATPMMVSAWQMHQAVKIIIGAEDGLLRKRLLLMNAQAGEGDLIALGD